MSEEKLHATLGASSAKRWINCSGSVSLIEKAPPPVESEFAKEGTTAHELMESLLLSMPNKIIQAALDGFKKKYGKEMYGHVYQMYVALNKRASQFDEILVEAKVSLDIVGPDMFGTVDCALVEHFGLLEVIDLKYGAGIAVEVEENFQLIYYALALAAKYNFNFERVRMTVYQPRAFHADGPWRSWEISISELMDWIVLFKKGVERVKQSTKGTPRYFSGEWCRFCSAAPICPEVATKALAQAKIDFQPESKKDFALPDPKDLSPEQMAIIMRKLDGLEAWLTNVKGYAFDLLNRGGKIEGWKLVPKRASRHWAELSKVEKEARKAFGDEAFTEPKLLSPSALEALGLADKNWTGKRTVSVSSGLTIARSSDPRSEASSVKQDFNDDITKEITNGKKSRKESNKKETSKKGSKEKSRKEDWLEKETFDEHVKRVAKKEGSKKSKVVDPGF